ncbi:MAG: PTS fructose transporter subunit IIABC [Metamycoplasmataceae bacterium]
MIEKYLNKDVALFDYKFKSKKDAIETLSKILVDKGFGENAKKIANSALEREKEFSTGIGNKIAMPHIRIPEMKKSVLLYAKVDPIDWDSLDNKKIEHIFFIALNDKDNVHMEIIQSLSKNIMNPEFIDKLDKNKTYKGLIELFKSSNIEEKEIIQANENGKYDIVAITACPTGIAHTYMARDALIAKAKEMGVSIKVETQGTEGARNNLTQQEIDNAGGVILAIDRAVDLGRFSNHENILETSTRKVMKKADEEIQFILDKKGQKLKTNGNSEKSENDQVSFNFDNFGKRLYKALMTGISYMLPFVIFGGIMIAIAFMIDIPNKDSGGNFGTINPGAKWFKAIGDLSFGLMIPMLSAYIAYALVGKIGLLPAFVTGMISAGKMGDFGDGMGWLGTPAGVNSGFFGAIAGGILVSVLIILLMKYIVIHVPKSLNGIMQILIIPFLGTLIIVGLFFLVNIPFLYINDGFSWMLNEIGKNSSLTILLGLMLGLMMATDMGGPINKSAYVFATLTLNNAAGEGSYAMASVMAAGMVPPLGIALSTAIFRKKLWTKEEVDTTAANVIMGLSFITEGAIPFAAKNPKVIIPASMMGAGVAGLLSAAFQIKLGAPHGGIFVFALVKSDMFNTDAMAIGMGITLYLVAIITGAIVTMLGIWLLRSVFDKKNGENQNNWFKNINIKKSNKNAKIEKMKIINYRNNNILWFTQ